MEENQISETSENKQTASSGKITKIGKKLAGKVKNDIKDLPGKIKNIDIKVGDSYQKAKSNIKLFFSVCLVAFLVMLLSAAAVFFTFVKGPEQVLVPNVIGKPLEDALLEMQVKELYPKINLRYSNTIGDEGTILDQSPAAGSIVKGYSRVSLVVSRGVIVNEIEDYVGKTLDEVQLRIQTLFAGQTRPLIVLAEPQYKPDMNDAGTILEQDPPAGTGISEPVTVTLIVSRGPNYENTRPPRVLGQSVNDLLQSITRYKVIFDISSHTAKDGEIPGTVVDQQTFEEDFVPNYSRMNVEMALPAKSVDDNIYGIYKAQIDERPYPIPMKLEATLADGSSYTIISLNHPGGNFTVPYAVPKGTTLTLYVADKVDSKKVVN